jgi:phospholipid/cholesterol/gamma-HCH transport system ATP-binding protein
MQDSSEASGSTAIIQMEDVTIASALSPARAIVSHVNWRVREGDYWVIGGLPGSGKSDLLVTTAGLARPLQGHLKLFGRNIAQLHEEELLRERLRIGLVFPEGGRLFNYLTIAQNVALPWYYHHNSTALEAETKAKAILELLELDPMAHQTPSRLRRNWRQRVALARALILRPEVLLLDNPLAGVDPPQVRWWLSFLGGLNGGHEIMSGRKVTLILTTEDLRPWKNQGRQFALINENKWCEVGGQAELAKNAEPLLRELLDIPAVGT